MSQDEKTNQELPNSIATVVQEDDGRLKTNPSMEANVIESLNEKKHGNEAVQNPEAYARFSFHSIEIDPWKSGVVIYPGYMEFRCDFLTKKFVWEAFRYGISVEYEWDDLQFISFIEERRELQLRIKKKPKVFSEKNSQLISTAYPPLWKRSSVAITNVFASETKLHVLHFSPYVYIELYGRFRDVAQVNSDLKNLICSGKKTTNLLAPNQIPLTLPQTSDVQPSPSWYQRPNQVQAQAEKINTNGRNHGKLKSGVKTEQQKAELQNKFHMQHLKYQAQIPYATSQIPYHPETSPQTSDVQPSQIMTREELKRPYRAQDQAQSVNTDLTLRHNPAAYGQEGAVCANDEISGSINTDLTLNLNPSSSSDSPPINGSPTAALSPDGNGNLIKFL